MATKKPTEQAITLPALAGVPESNANHIAGRVRSRVGRADAPMRPDIAQNTLCHG